MNRRILPLFFFALSSFLSPCLSASVGDKVQSKLQSSGNASPGRKGSEATMVLQHDGKLALLRKDNQFEEKSKQHAFVSRNGANAPGKSSGRKQVAAEKSIGARNQTASHNEQIEPSNPYTGVFVFSVLLAVVFLSQARTKQQHRDINNPEDINETSTSLAANSSDADTTGSTLVLTDRVALMGLLFLLIIFVGMLCTRFLACDVWQLQCDRGYSFKYFLREDFHKVVLDMAFLYVIGRLGASSSLRIDSVAFVAIVIISALLFSWIQELSFMKHSLSMYQMSCSWDAMTWVAFASIVVVVLGFVLAHLYHFISADRSTQARAMLEFVVILGIFVLPRAFESGNHMHHWYTMWLLSNACRLPYLWSRGAQAFLIGGYINGVAIYGRDPVLACQAAYDLAYSQQCLFLTQCTVNSPSGPVPTTYQPPDWRTCNPGDYA